MSPRKQLPPPSAGIDLATALRGRYNHTQQDDETTAEESATPRTSSTDDRRSTGARSATANAKPAAPPAVRRSWYMLSSTADSLSKAIEDEHFATRRPKAEILDALITTALAHRDEWHTALVAGSSRD